MGGVGHAAVGWVIKSTGWGAMCHALVNNLIQCNLIEN